MGDHAMTKIRAILGGPFRSLSMGDQEEGLQSLDMIRTR